MPALNLTEPAHLLAKLEHETQTLVADVGDSYAAINALRDAYHLSEWIWGSRLKHNPALQVEIMGRNGKRETWFAWVKQNFANFPIIEELCNGSKHFQPGSKIRAIHRPGWDSPVSFWNNPQSGWNDNSFYVEVDAGRLISVVELVTGIRDFWRGLFAQFPQLA